MIPRRFSSSQTIIGSIFFLLSILGLIDIASLNHASGIIGRIVALPFLKLFGIYISIIFLGAILIISILVLFDKRPQLISLWPRLVGYLKGLWSSRRHRGTDAREEKYEEEIEDEGYEEPEQEAMEYEEAKESEKTMRTDVKKQKVGVEEIRVDSHEYSHKFASIYTPPPLSLLERDKGKPNVGDIKANSNIIKRTLANFGIEVEMDEVTIGPTITRYALKPAEGVKLSRILGLQNDLSLALAAHPLRIEAPIPGKSLVGIEIPNKTKSIVGLASLLSDDIFQTSNEPLLVALGRRLSGKSLFASLVKMPHLLIGGATGSGKSVTIHAIKIGRASCRERV